MQLEELLPGHETPFLRVELREVASVELLCHDSSRLIPVEIGLVVDALFDASLLRRVLFTGH